MNVIQSFWSKPAFHNKHELSNKKKFAGWLQYKYFLYSICFSCLTIKRYHPKLMLYTDDKGYDLFFKKLRLPYQDISLALNDLKNEDPGLWVVGRFIALQQQQQPFIHVDTDVYLWKKLPRLSHSNSVITQSEISLPAPYKKSLEGIISKFRFVPSCLLKKTDATTTVANIGIMGGSDLGFFREYCTLALEILNRNRSSLKDLNVSHFNEVLDEYLFTCFAREKNYPMRYLIPSTRQEVKSSSMNNVLRFNQIPLVDKYIHLVGMAKKNQYACEQLELRFEYEFPDYYKRVQALLKEKSGGEIQTGTEDEERKQRLKKVLPVLYEKEIDNLLNKKFQLIDQVSIRENANFKGEDKLSLVKHDPVSDDKTITPLLGTDCILAWFQSPVSMNELLEELRSSDSGENAEEFEEQRKKLIDIVTEKIFIEGLLELAA